MLERIVNILKSTKYRVADGTVFCENYIIADLEAIEYLEEENAFENILAKKELGTVVNLELSLAHLNAFGFYEDCATFVLKNKFEIPSNLYYIDELNCYSSEKNEFFIKYASVLNLISGIKNIAKYSYRDVDIEKSIIYRDNQSAFLAFEFDFKDMKSVKVENLDKVNLIAEVFQSQSDTERKLVFINQVIEFVNSKEEAIRFKLLLAQIDTFYEKCNNAYQFYLRDFSYNKLKMELDSKALEYTQKIQSVINESQTKLIAIPTAFVLAFAAFDFVNLSEMKNVAVMLSLFVFATLIQIFINNQKSTLNFISDNIDSYMETFEKNIDSISSKFSLVEDELKKQRTRLIIMEFINWGIPIMLVCLWLFMLKYQVLSLIVCILFIAIMAILEFVIK
jgi:hypothetical protein